MHTYRIDFETAETQEGIILYTDLNEFGAAMFISDNYNVIGYISIKKVC